MSDLLVRGDSCLIVGDGLLCSRRRGMALTINVLFSGADGNWWVKFPYRELGAHFSRHLVNWKMRGGNSRFPSGMTTKKDRQQQQRKPEQQQIPPLRCGMTTKKAKADGSRQFRWELVGEKCGGYCWRKRRSSRGE